MKKRDLFITVLVMALSASTVVAQGISFFHGSFEEAMQQAARENKQIYVDVYTSWCGPCKQMAATVFPIKEVGDYFNAHFICLELDAEKEHDNGFFKRYNAGSYPSFFWLSAKGELLETHVGLLTPDEFIATAKKASVSNLSALNRDYQERWDKGERTLELVKNFVYGIAARIHPDSVKGYVVSYLSTLNEEQLRSEDTYKAIAGFMRDAQEGPIFDCLTKYAANYEKYEPYPQFRIKMYRMLVRSGNAAIQEGKMDRYNRIVGLVRNCALPDKGMYLDIMDMENSLQHKKFEEGVGKMAVVADKYGYDNPYLFEQFFYSVVVSGYFKDTVSNAGVAREVVDIAEKAFEFSGANKTTVLYLGLAYSRAGMEKRAVETLATLPYVDEPKLPGILFQSIGISIKPGTEFGKTEKCKEVKARLQAVVAGGSRGSRNN